MQPFDDDPDFGGSQEGSSDEEQNDQMDDAEEDGDAEEEGEGDDEEDGDAESDENNEGDDTMMIDSQQSESADPMKAAVSTQAAPISLGETPVLAPTSHPRTPTLTSPTRLQGNSGDEQMNQFYPAVRAEALGASIYDIVPTIAAPQSTSINSVTATPDLRWVFSGGSDGYIRKFNWADTANGKLMLTVAQRHPFVDSVVKAGVLTSYWENEDPYPKLGDPGASLSPVYSLAVHHQALWLLSGLESGGINLQSVRHEEGKRIHYLKQHTSAVSVLTLAQDERSVLSGSWDRTILDWDLNTGQVKRRFDGRCGQISAVETRPLSSLPVPATFDDTNSYNDTALSDSAKKPRQNGVLTNGTSGQDQTSEERTNDDGIPAGPASPADSLFGGNDQDSLFGDNDDNALGDGSGQPFGDDYDDEFSRAIATGIQPQAEPETTVDTNMPDAMDTEGTLLVNGISDSGKDAPTDAQRLSIDASQTLTNGLPHGDDYETRQGESNSSSAVATDQPVADSVFLASSINGSLRIWDKRKPDPVAKIPPKNTPPWCMGACWSPDGNFIYAGRRNGTVEEFSLHKGFRSSERVFRFPQGSGSVTAVRAMPNGRHLVCASYDILRLYDLQHQQATKHSTVPFLIIPGHRTGTISQLYVDPTCRFMISSAGNRGWEGNTTQVLLGYEINI